MDATFTDRDYAAVQEWLESPLAFHFIRDHPWHGTTIMGGGWGVKYGNGKVRDQMKNVWTKMEKHPQYMASRKVRDPDQVLLDK